MYRSNYLMHLLISSVKEQLSAMCFRSPVETNTMKSVTNIYHVGINSAFFFFSFGEADFHFQSFDFK